MTARNILSAIALGWLCCAICPPALAQSDWARFPVPSYLSFQVLQGLHRHWTEPQAAAFAAKAGLLQPALRGLCAAPASGAATSLRDARQAWRDTMLAWERLAAVPLGPLIQRRSMRAIDFNPTRPALIERAVAGMPAAGGVVPALDRIGTPAKGLPALEWLLWTRPAAPGSAACRYAVVLAGEIEQEAGQLHAAFRSLAERDADAWDNESASAGVSEFINQWIGGVERLRWPNMDKPLRARRPAEFPRAASSETRAAWAAQWEGLRRLAVFDRSGPAPAPGAGVVPLETWLRGRGANPLADKLVQTVARVDARLRGLSPAAGTTRVQQAVRELSSLKRLAEAEVAPALEVSVGFSDADGD